MPPRQRQTNNPPARNQTSNAGDYTGREKARLTSEKSEEVAEAQKRVGLMTAADTAAEEHGIFDAETQEVVAGFEDIDEATAAQAEQIVFEDDEILDPERPQQRPLDPMQDVQEPVTQQRPPVIGENPYEIPDEAPSRDRATVVQNPKVVFRVNSDVEDMTFGREVHDDDNGNQVVGELRNLSFYRGRRYRAPRDIYDHLEDRGLIYH